MMVAASAGVLAVVTESLFFVLSGVLDGVVVVDVLELEQLTKRVRLNTRKQSFIKLKWLWQQRCFDNPDSKIYFD